MIHGTLVLCLAAHAGPRMLRSLSFSRYSCGSRMPPSHRPLLSPPLPRLEAEREERLAAEAADEKKREEEEKKEKHKEEWLQARLEWNKEVLNKQRMKRRHRIREQTLVMKNKFNARWIVKRAELVAAARKEVPDDDGTAVGLRGEGLFCSCSLLRAACSNHHTTTHHTTPHRTTPHLAHPFSTTPRVFVALRAGAKLLGQPAQHVRDPPQHQGALHVTRPSLPPLSLPLSTSLFPRPRRPRPPHPGTQGQVPRAAAAGEPR